MRTWIEVLTDIWNLLIEAFASPQGQKLLADIEALLGATPPQSPSQGQTGNTGTPGPVGEIATPSFVSQVEQKVEQVAENAVSKFQRGKQSSTVGMVNPK